jgi:membrane protein
MVALGLVLLVSLTVAFGAEALLDRLVMAAGGDGLTATRWFMALVGFVFGFAVNTLFAVAVLTLLPRLRVPWRRVLVPAVVIAIGVEGLTSMGRLVVARAEANPAFQVVAGAAGLLVFLLILNQLILFAAALTATGTGGRVVDLATGQRLDADAPARPRPTVSQRPDPDRDVTPQQPTTPSP